MKVSHIEHLGIAVKSLDTAIPYWEKMLGTKCYNIEEVAEQKVKTVSLKSEITKDRPVRSSLSPKVRSASSSKRGAKACTMWLLPSMGSKTVWPNARRTASN